VPTFGDDQWLENFRLRKGTFDYICSHVRPFLEPSPSPVIPNRSISVEKTVAIALYKLAHVAEYKLVGNQFGVHKSSVHNCFMLFAWHLFMQWEMNASNSLRKKKLKK